MAFETDFLQLMKANIVYAATSSLSAYGKSAFTAGTTYKGLVQYQDKLVRALDGKEKISTANAVIGTTAQLKPTGRFTLPDGTTPPVLSLQRMNDSGGAHHVRVYFGGANRGGG